MYNTVWYMHCSANVVYYFISFTHKHLLIISKMNTSYSPLLCRMAQMDHLIYFPTNSKRKLKKNLERFSNLSG